MEKNDTFYGLIRVSIAAILFPIVIALLFHMSLISL